MRVNTADGCSRPNRAARRAVASAVVCCLLMSCGTPDQRRGPETRTGQAPSPTQGGPTGTPAQHPSPSATAHTDEKSDAQSVPRADDAAAFARSLNHAATIVGNKQSSAAEIRKAAESQQLVVRTLADSPRGFRRTVIARLDPETAVVTQGAVDAARSLARIHVPAPARPPWRIVAPPPPAELLRYYHQAQRRTGVNWSYLAAMNLVETRMGRIRGDSPSGARGPMQFVPSTWDLYGAGGDINNPRDAILAAARLLRANGAPGDMRHALLHYNPAEAYVRAITEYAHTMRQSRSAYLAYWNWRVIYRHGRATYVLPVGYPKRAAIPLESRTGR